MSGGPRSIHLSLLLATLLCGCSLSGCSPVYVLRAAYQGGEILAARRPIPEVIADPDSTADERTKLARVLQARSFAEQLGLTPADSFTMYSRVDRDVLAWVVVGSKADAFALYTWWFPVVGSVPYKGFFERADATAAADELIAEGYETSVRGTEAISTLGWFNDPILSTTLKHPELQVVNTVLHEILHSTIWFPDHVDFNESLANYVGHRATIDFYRGILAQCRATGGACEAEQKLREEAEEDLRRELSIGDSIERLYAALNTLYQSGRSKEQILVERTQVFDREVAPLRQQFPQMRALKSINNAEIVQLKLYLTGLRKFDALFAKSVTWPKFLAELQGIKEKFEGSEMSSPFELIDRPVG